MHLSKLMSSVGFAGGSVVKESGCQCRDAGLISGLEGSPGGGNTHSSILAGKIPWTGSLVGYSPWGLIESDKAEHAHPHMNSVTKDKFYCM